MEASRHTEPVRRRSTSSYIWYYGSWIIPLATATMARTLAGHFPDSDHWVWRSVGALFGGAVVMYTTYTLEKLHLI